MMTSAPLGPLILGASGRIGRMFQTLWAGGHWPSPDAPVWHARTGPADLIWDMADPLPASLPPCRGMIVLAGATSGENLSANTDVALRALDLAQTHDIGPVLICSSSAVYGRAQGPQSETAAPQPANPYGQAKLDMEHAVAGHSTAACCLRIGNVAGADAALIAAARGPVQLDQFADGSTPRRMYIGPLTLAKTLLALINAPSPLPPILNLAQPGLIAMGDLLDAAQAPWSPQTAPDMALPELTLDLTALGHFHMPPTATAATLVAQARQAGWTPSP